MQIDRLFDIIYTLLSGNTVTAKELAERFGVSQRTIYRDIDTLSLAGIPVYTNKGRGGGISLLDEFVLDKSVLSEKEQSEIMIALHGLGAIRPAETREILQKLGAFWNRAAPDWIAVDFSDWSHYDNHDFSRLKAAILESRIVRFEYFGSDGEILVRRVEPIQLWFKHKAWYLKGFCLERNALRLFKLTRLKNLDVSDEIFPQRDLLSSVAEERPGKPPRPDIRLVFRIAPEMTYRVYDEFDPSRFVIHEDGSLTVTTVWPEDEWVYGFILSFGEYIEVVSPEHVRRIVAEKLESALQIYRK